MRFLGGRIKTGTRYRITLRENRQTDKQTKIERDRGGDRDRGERERKKERERDREVERK